MFEHDLEADSPWTAPAGQGGRYARTNARTAYPSSSAPAPTPTTSPADTDHATVARRPTGGGQSTRVRPVRCRKTSSRPLRRTSTLAGLSPNAATSATAASPSGT